MTTNVSQSGRRILDGTVRIFIAEALILPTGLITAAFLTRRLGPEGYGLLTLVSVIIAWLEFSIVVVFSHATIHLVSKNRGWQPIAKTIVRAHLVTSCLVALLIYLFANPIVGLVNEPRLELYLKLFAIDIPLFSLAKAHRNILIGIGDFRQRAIMSAGRWVSRLILIVLLVELGLSVPGAILGSIGASLVELLVGRFYTRPAIFGRLAFPTRQLFIFAMPLLFYGIGMRLFDKLDLFMLKILGGTAAQAGVYGAAQNLTLVPSIFVMSFSPLLLSTLNRILQAGNPQQAKELGRNAMRIILLLLPFAAMTAGAASEIMDLIFGPDFIPAAPVLAVLMFGALAVVFLSVTTVILVAADHANWLYILTSPMILLALVGHWWLIPKWGPVGAATVTTLIAGMGAMGGMLVVYKIWQISPPPMSLLRAVTTCLAAYGLAISWSSNGPILLLKLTVICATIPMLLFLMGEFSNSELSLARSLFRQKEPVTHKPSEVT